MTLEEQCRLSYYKKIADISTHKNVSLVQHVESMRIFVRKEQEVYSRSIYEYLKHCGNPHIPKIYECIEDEGRLIVIEEYIQGESLTTRLEHGMVYRKQEVCELMITVCDVLEQLHQLPVPVIHRDLKPENILIQDNGYVKIIDFNTAKQFEDGRGCDTVIIGTREYAAPEQYGFSQSDARTDIYAMGVMMNYLLTGKYPREAVYMEGSSVPELMTKMIRRCTAFDPASRYQTVMELRADLQSVLGGNAQKVKKEKHTRRDAFPPGFRTGKVWKMLLSGLGYWFIFWVALTLEVNDADGIPAAGFELWINRVTVLIWMLLTVAFCTDYMGMQKKFPLMSNKRRRWIGYFLWPTVFLFVLVCIMLWIVG